MFNKENKVDVIDCAITFESSTNEEILLYDLVQHMQMTVRKIEKLIDSDTTGKLEYLAQQYMQQYIVSGNND